MIQLEYEQQIKKKNKKKKTSDISKIISKISESACPPSTNCNAIGCELCWENWLSDKVKKLQENK